MALIGVNRCESVPDAEVALIRAVRVCSQINAPGGTNSPLLPGEGRVRAGLRKPFPDYRPSLCPYICLALALLLFASGCAPLSHRIAANEARRFHNVTVSAVREESFKVTSEVLKAKGVTSSFSSGKVDVICDSAHAWLATGLAGEMSSALSVIEKRTGIDYQYRLRFYLVEVDEVPQTYRFSLTAKERAIEVPLFFRAQTRSLTSFVEQNQIALYYSVHELTEQNLCAPVKGTPVLADTFFGFYYIKSYTRWFREGMADYAAYIAIDVLKSDLGARIFPADSPSVAVLSAAGADLFKWHQLSRSDKDIYYRAAFTLFFLIDARYGDDCIRQIVGGVNSLKYADGDALIALTNKAIGTDVVKMVSGIRFGDPGFSMEIHVSDGHEHSLLDMTGVWVADVDSSGPAAKAGLQTGDRITAVNGSPITEYQTIVLAVYRGLDRPSMDVTVLRGPIEKTVSIPIDRNLKHKAPKAFRPPHNTLSDWHHFLLAVQTATRFSGTPSGLLP
jgi:hypothetical protein